MLLALALRAFADDNAENSVDPVLLLQLWGTAWDQDADVQADSTGIGDIEDDPGVKLKRFRLGFAGQHDALSYRLVAGLSAPYDGLETPDESVEVVDALMSYRVVKGLSLQAGRAKVPFSRDQIMSTAELTFQEKGFVAEYIAPDRALGFLVIGQGAGVRGQVGVFNSGGSLFGDDNAGKTYVGRVEYTLGQRDVYSFYGKGEGLGLGIGAGGFMTDDVGIRTTAAGGDVMLRVAGLGLLVDGAWSTLSPDDTDVVVPGVFAETTRTAITTQVSYALGVWEPAVRFSGYNDSTLGQYGQILGGLVWHGNDDVLRVGGGYVHRLEEGNLPNSTIRLWTQMSF